MSSHSTDNHSDNDHETHSVAFVDQNSVQDKFLCTIAGLTLCALIILGAYWQSLPLPAVQLEEQSVKK